MVDSINDLLSFKIKFRIGLLCDFYGYRWYSKRVKRLTKLLYYCQEQGI